MANSVDPDQTATIGAVCSGSMLFASIHSSSVMLDNYLQQTTSAEDIFRCIYFLALKGYGLNIVHTMRYLIQERIICDGTPFLFSLFSVYTTLKFCPQIDILTINLF